MEKKIYKVTSNHFSPSTLHFVEAAKKNSQKATTLDNAFPDDRHIASMEIVQAMVSPDSVWIDPYECLLLDTDKQKLFTTFVFFLSFQCYILD
jgi:hypothetical protein